MSTPHEISSLNTKSNEERIERERNGKRPPFHHYFPRVFLMVSPGEWAARKATTLLTLSFSTTPDRAQPLPPCPLLLLSQRSTTSNNRVRTFMKVIDKNFHGARESTTMFVPTDASRPSSSPFARCLSGMQLLKARRTATLFPLPMKNAPSPVASLKSHPFVSSPLASGDFFASASPRNVERSPTTLARDRDSFGNEMLQRYRDFQPDLSRNEKDKSPGFLAPETLSRIVYLLYKEIQTRHGFSSSRSNSSS